MAAEGGIEPKGLLRRVPSQPLQRMTGFLLLLIEWAIQDLNHMDEYCKDN